MDTEMVEVNREKFKSTLESLQRKIPRLSRHSFSLAFDTAIAIEAQRGLEAYDRLINQPYSFYRDDRIEKMKRGTEKRIAYLQSLQKEALEYYDGKKEGTSGEESDA